MRLSAFVLLAIAFVSLCPEVQADPPPLRFLRTGGDGVRLRASTSARVAMPDINPPVVNDSDSDDTGNLDSGQETTISAAQVGPYQSLSQVQGDIVVEGHGDTTISAPAIAVGVHDLFLDEVDPGDAQLSANVQFDWDVQFHADDEGGARVGAGVYQISVSLAYNAGALSNGFNPRFNDSCTGSLEINVGGEIVRIYLSEEGWVSDNGTVQFVEESVSGNVSVVASLEVVINHGDAVTISGGVGYAISASAIEDSTLLGTSALAVQVTIQ